YSPKHRDLRGSYRRLAKNDQFSFAPNRANPVSGDQPFQRSQVLVATCLMERAATTGTCRCE
ncbi:MAG: hypothetical protein WCV00_24350, partial [Verrucomicrobiia bacterium]